MIEIKKGATIGIDPGNGIMMARKVVDIEIKPEGVFFRCVETGGKSERRWAKDRLRKISQRLYKWYEQIF